MLQFKKTKITFELPAGWHEVPFEDAMAIVQMDEFDYIKTLSILTGVPENDIKKSTDAETVYSLVNSMGFLTKSPVKKHPEFPKSITTIEEKPQKLTLPYVKYANKFDLGRTSVGQVEDMKHVISQLQDNEPIKVLNCYAVITAIYLQPIVEPVSKDEKYDYDYAFEVFTQYVRNHIDYATVSNMGAFFFERLHGLMNGLQTEESRAALVQRKFRQGLSNLVQRLDSMLH